MGERGHGHAGLVSAANSLVGTTTGDQVGRSVAPLTNGNYVVGSPIGVMVRHRMRER